MRIKRLIPLITPSAAVIIVALVFALAACQSAHLEPETVSQERVASLTDYERLQIAVETVVLNANTPAEVKDALKALELQATQAVLALDEAKGRGLPGSVLDFKLEAAIAALSALQQYLIAKGYGS